MSEYSAPGRPRPWNGRSTQGLVHGCISGGGVAAVALVCPGGIDIREKLPPSKAPDVGPRGKIYGLSPASRRRLLRNLIRLPPPIAGSSLLGLTYHHGAGPDPALWHSHLHNFFRELREAFGAFGPEWVWVLEAQRRGAPHFHVLVLWERAPHPIQLRRWVARVWHRIADPTSPEHAKAGTRVDAIAPDDRRAARRLTAYLTKYLAKDDQKAFIDKETGERLPSGRMWGKTLTERNTRETPVVLTGDEAAQLRRRIRRWGASSPFLRKFGRQFFAGVVLGDWDRLGQLLRGLGYGSSPPSEASP
jgi:hypothetical protein